MNDIINEIIEGLCKIYDKECSHIFLYGSASIGKLSYRMENNMIDFYSDIEFIVIPKDKSNENNKIFKEHLMELSSQYLKSHKNVRVVPFIDVNPVSKKYFETREIRISTFELKHNAKCLKGENLLNYLPEINSNNYNSSIQNIEIVKGLKILLLESYSYFLNNDITSKYDKIRYNYFLSASYLNVLRTLLPIFNIFKLNIDDRINEFVTLKRNNKICKYFEKDIIENFEKIANRKEKGDFIFESEKLLEITYQAYKSLLCLILECEGKDLMINIRKKRNSLFYGDKWRKNMLANLTCYFISGLDSLIELITTFKVSNKNLIAVRESYDKLLYGDNAFEFKEIIKDYAVMEKNRWKIIGSKD